MANVHPAASSIETYRVVVRGALTGYWTDWFSGMVANIDFPRKEISNTTLTVCVPDQPALRGILNKLWDLNCILISVEMVHPISGSEGAKG
jgi:hypothetical protein